MDKNLIAVSHPGKIGDALYTLPTIRYLANTLDVDIDFYTSEYCKPLCRLMGYQKEIRNVLIPPAYKALRDDVGIQPWKMPIDVSAYDKVYQLGFRNNPITNLPSYIANIVGIPLGKMPKVYYEYPKVDTLNEPYLCIAPRGNTTYKDLFREVIINSPIAVVIIGGAKDNITVATKTIFNKSIIDLTGLDMLETVSWLSKSVGFMGLMSAMLVLANGFDMIKIVPHDNIHWNLNHVLKTISHKYMVLPTASQVIQGFGL